MYLPIRFISRFLIAAGCLFSLLPAVGTRFLAVPSSAAELALGGQVALARNPLVNPASPGPAAPVVQFSYGGWFAGSRISTLTVTHPLAAGGLRIGLRTLGLDDLELRPDRPTDQPLARYGAYGFSLDGGISQNLGRWRTGAALHLVRIQMYTEHSLGFATDLGLQYVPNDYVTLGAALLNLGRMSALDRTPPRLPLRLLLGAGLHWHHPLVPSDLGLAVEKAFLNRGLILHITSQSTWNGLGLTLGTSLAPAVVMVSAGLGIQLDRFTLQYSIRAGSQRLGLPQMLDLAIRLP